MARHCFPQSHQYFPQSLALLGLGPARFASQMRIPHPRHLFRRAWRGWYPGEYPRPRARKGGGKSSSGFFDPSPKLHLSPLG